MTRFVFHLFSSVSESLLQHIDLDGKTEIFFRQSALAVSRDTEADIVPSMNQNIRMVIHALSLNRHTVDEFHRLFKVIEFEIPDDRFTLAAPVA